MISVRVQSKQINIMMMQMYTTNPEEVQHFYDETPCWQNNQKGILFVRGWNVKVESKIASAIIGIFALGSEPKQETD